MIEMTDSQFLFWLAIAGVCAWAPIMLLVWTIKKSKSGASPAEELWTDLRQGVATMIERWPTYAAGQKRFLCASSFACGAATIGLARIGAEAASWLSVTFGGMSAVEAQVKAPLGSWWWLLAIQASCAAAFFVWLQLGRKSRLD